MRGSVLVAVAVAISACGCGAKSGLEVLPREPIDAAAPPIDASIDTLPCRWTAGRALALGVDGPSSFVGTIGAADARREVFALRGEREAGWIDPTFLVTAGDPPRLLSETLVEAEEPVARTYFARSGGWLEITSNDRACTARWRDESFAIVRAEQLRDLPCGADALGREQIALLARTPGAIDTLWEVWTLAAPPGSMPAPLHDASGPTRAPPRAAIGRDGTVFVVWVDAETSAIGALARGPDGTFALAEAIAEGSGVAPRVAPDRLLGGAVMLSRAASGWRLDRLRVAGATLTLAPLLDLSALGDRVPLDVELVTNETEALFALDDGTIVYVPLAGADLRTIDAPAGGATRARVILAEGSSFGGVVWAGGAGGRQLFFRSLVCNR